MTTKRRPTETVKAQREDLDATMREYRAAADGIKYRVELSASGQADARRALTAQYLANLTSDAAAGWKIATAALSTAKADYQRAHAAYSERLDPARLSWLARETASRLAAAAYVGAGVGSFDPVAWLGSERDRLAAAGDVTAMRALRVVARENLSRALDGQSAGRLALVLQADEDAEQRAVIEARNEVQAAEAAADDLRRRIEAHRLTLDPSAGNALAGSDAFAVAVFGGPAVPVGAVMSS